ncbi:MAG: hypothetical protein ABIL46_06245 [candidate division WOR-3 bacterium]
MKKLLIIAFLFSIIYADVTYEMETVTQGIMSIGNAIMTIRNFIKGDCMRTEIKSENSPEGKMGIVTITRLDKGVVWILDTEKKEFLEIPVNEEKFDTDLEPLDFIPEIKIERMNETKKILKVSCTKYLISININLENGIMQINQTMWVGKDFPGYNEIMTFNKKMQSSINGTTIPGLDNKIFKELQKRISEIDGFPMEMELTVNIDSEGTQIEMKSANIIKKLSTVPISDRVFEIPEGYTPKTILGTE